MQKIGAESTWVMSNDDIYFNFADTGDWMRSSRRLLESVINAGVRTIIYDGDVVRSLFRAHLSDLSLSV